MGLVRPSEGYPAAACCISIVHCAVAYVPLWMTDLASFYDADAAARVTRGLASVGLRDVAAVGEELGWFGVLLPRLIDATVVATVVATLVWRKAPVAAPGGPACG